MSDGRPWQHDAPRTTERAIGDRVAELRARRGMTQEDLAEQAGLHVSSVKKIEAGGSGRMETYHAIARVFGVVTMTFVPPSMAAPEPAGSDGLSVALSALRSVIMPAASLNGPIPSSDDIQESPNLRHLARSTRSFTAAYHDGRYDDIAEMAPRLIRSAHFHVGAVSDDQRQEALRLRGDLLSMTGRYLIQIRAHDLAMIALRDALADAQAAGDRPLAVNILGRQAWVMLRHARFAEAERLCVAVADEVEPKLSSATVEEVAAWGEMLINAAAAATRNNRPQESDEYLTMAAAAGARLGVEHNDLAGHKNFGPLTVAVKRVESEIIAGHPDRALVLAGELPRSAGRLNPSDWNRHQVDHASALIQCRDLDQATAKLSALRRQAPGWMRYQSYARSTVAELLHARRRITDEERELATFLMVDA